MFVLIWATLLFTVRSNSATNDLKPTVMIPPMTEGQQTTLTCTAPFNFSECDLNITWAWSGAGENDSHITGNITVNQGQNSTLTFNSSVIHHGTKITCKISFSGGMTEEKVTLNVTYVKKPKITGRTTVKEGDALNLTCSVDSFPPSVITWTKPGLNRNLNTETEPDQYNVMATLVIPNVTAEYFGQYLCIAKHPNSTLTEDVIITVTFDPKILNSSGCINQSEVLTCTCISQGVPLPTIKWPLLENHTEYSGITTVLNYTVNNTVIITVKDHRNTVVCVSSNTNGEVKRSLIINKVEEEGQIRILLRIATRLEILIAFLIGALISAIICCLARKCHRKKQKTYGNLAETLEMVTNQEDSLINAGQAVENDQATDQEAAEGEGAVAAGKSDVEYSNLDFSLIKRKGAAEAGTTQETTDTEYAEIKREAEVRQDGEGKEEEEMIGVDEGTKHCVPDEKEGEDVALYSTVKDLIGFEDSVA